MIVYFFFFQAEDGIRDLTVTGVQTCALPIWVWRCFVIAWRVTPLPRLSRVIESGPSADRRPSSRSRMGSPNATNTGTASLAFGAAAPRLGDIRRQVLDLPSPSRVVCRSEEHTSELQSQSNLVCRL